MDPASGCAEISGSKKILGELPTTVLGRAGWGVGWQRKADDGRGAGRVSEPSVSPVHRTGSIVQVLACCGSGLVGSLARLAACCSGAVLASHQPKVCAP